MKRVGDAWALRNFLMAQPRPVTIRLHNADGELSEMSPARKSWSKTAESIHALQPELVELLDAEGRVIRAMRPGDATTTSEHAPVAPQVIVDDPETARLTHFANLIHRAYEHSTQIAFDKMIELVERLGDRSESVEARLERQEALNRRLWQAQVDDALERADEVAANAATNTDAPNDAQQAMMAAFLQSALTAKPNGANGATPKPNGANGKG